MRNFKTVLALSLLLVCLCASRSASASQWDISENWDTNWYYYDYIYSWDYPWHSSASFNSSYGAYVDNYYVYSGSYAIHLGYNGSYGTYYYDDVYLNYDFDNPTPVAGTLSFMYMSYYMALYVDYTTNGSTWNSVSVYSDYQNYSGWMAGTVNIPSGTRGIRFRGYAYYRYYYMGLWLDDINFKITDIGVVGITGFSDVLNTGAVELTAQTQTIYAGVDSVEWQCKRSLDTDWSASYTDYEGSDGFMWGLDLTGKDDLAFSVRARASYGGITSDWYITRFKVQNFAVSMTPPNPTGGEFNLQVAVSNEPFDTIYPVNDWKWTGQSYYYQYELYLVNTADPIPFAGTAKQLETNFYYDYGGYSYEFILYSQVSGSTSFNEVARTSSLTYATGKRTYELTGSQWANLPANLLIGVHTYYYGYHYYYNNKPYAGNPETIYYRYYYDTYWYGPSSYESIPFRVAFETTGVQADGIVPSYRIGDGAEVGFSSSAVTPVAGGFVVNWKSWAVDSDEVMISLRLKVDGNVLDYPYTFGPFTVRNRVNASFSIAKSPAASGVLEINPGDSLVYLTIDGSDRPVPYTEDVPYFRSFSVSAPPTIPDKYGAIWRFDRWSDGGGRSHDAQISPQVSTAFTAYYARQYYFEVDSDRPEFTAPAQGFYDPGTVVNIQVSSIAYDNDTVRYRYTGYTVDSTALSGTDTWISLTMNQRVVVRLSWQIEYYFEVVGMNGAGSGTPNGWYPEGTSVGAAVPQTIANGPGARVDNRGYMLNGTPLAGRTFSGVLDQPILVDFFWEQQYYLVVSTNSGTVSPSSDWFDEGAPVAIDAQPPMPEVDRRYTFQGWQGTGQGSVSTSSPDTPQTVFVLSSISQVASWKVEYSVQITAVNGTISGDPSGWYPYGYSFVINAIAPSAGPGSRWLPSWSGTGASSITTVIGESVPASVTLTITDPVAQQVEWFLQHTLTVANPDGIGNVNPAPGSYWIFDGDEVTGLATFLANDMLCAGFTGTGAATSDTTPYFTLTMTAPASITWLWQARKSPGAQSWEEARQLMQIASPYAYTLALDEVGKPAIAWYDPDSRTINLVRFVDGVLEVFELVADVPYTTMLALAIDSQGQPHVAWYHSGEHRLHYSGFATTEDKSDLAILADYGFDLEGDSGLSPDIAVSAAGDIFISFYDLGAASLCLAILWQGTTSWVIETVDDQDNPGQFNSLAVRPADGAPAIAYRSITGRELRYAVRTSEGWVRSVVDDDGDQGHHPFLTHTPDGVPYIAYQDVSDSRRFHLKFATLVGTEWNAVTVDNSDGTGYHPSVVVDGDGTVHISYHNQSTAFYARYDHQVWTLNTLAGDAVIGETMVYINGGGLPAVIFNDGGSLEVSDAKSTTGGGGTGGGTGGDDPGATTGGGGGCFIASASFGSISAFEVAALTSMRDGALASSTSGAAITELYYSTSPSVAAVPRSLAPVSALIRRLLD